MVTTTRTTTEEQEKSRVTDYEYAMREHIKALYEQLHGRSFTDADVDKEWKRLQEEKKKQ